jgi:hypothetical protein
MATGIAGLVGSKGVKATQLEPGRGFAQARKNAYSLYVLDRGILFYICTHTPIARQGHMSTATFAHTSHFAPGLARELVGSAIDPALRRGRGAVRNASGRHEVHLRTTVDDGWGVDPGEAFKTEVTIERAKTIITRNVSPDISFDRSINPYRGCEHGCAYCFARPSHANMGLSPGLDFETRLFAKTNAPELLERELSAAGYTPRTMAIGTNTDPYQPIERTHRIMRGVL